jgi:hypothetical protein
VSTADLLAALDDCVDNSGYTPLQCISRSLLKSLLNCKAPIETPTETLLKLYCRYIRDGASAELAHARAERASNTTQLRTLLEG